MSDRNRSSRILLVEREREREREREKHILSDLALRDVRKGGGHGVLPSQWLHDSSQLLLTML